MGKKVFELAKELDIRSVELVEKLRSLGMNVRNHMVLLTDEEEQKALESFAKKEEPVKKKKVVKKKKKVAKKVASSAATEEGEEKPVKKKVVKKKVVTIKKKAKKKVAASAPKESDIADAPPIEKIEETTVSEAKVPDTSNTPEVDLASSVEAPLQAGPDKEKNRADSEVIDEKLYKEDYPTGLKVIEKPAEELVEKEVEQKAPVEEKTDSKVFKEKMHSFTPVFIPESSPEREKSSPTEQSVSAKKKYDPNESAEAIAGSTGKDDSGEQKGKKKRIGDLAAMMNKKSSTDKSKDITMLRAEEELKFASDVLGRTVYTPQKRKKIYSGSTKNTEITEVKDSKRVVYIHGGTTVGELAQKLSQKFDSLADKCLELNLLVDAEDFVGFALAEEIAALYRYRVEDKAFNEDEVLSGDSDEEKKDNAPTRNPIVTVMGHVDHGKTTLLDYIRRAKVADGEAGGITQHIGAYSVSVKDSTITFLDTPGHAAFANMRERGASVTDVVILVVAADDGVMPQTKESVRFIQNAGVPLVVAINKMDREGANPDRVKQELMEFGISPEEWGGDTQFVPVSALKGEGIDELLEAVKLQADIMELKANPKGKAEGVVIESQLETGRGPVCTVIVQKGTLKKGDSMVVGECYGRARSLIDTTGKTIQSAGPSTPVQILGLNETPTPGDTFNIVKNEREAKKVVENRVHEKKQMELASKKKLSLEAFFATESKDGEKKVLKLLVRSDVQGSFEAIKNSVESLGNDEVAVEVIGGGVGAITDSDVLLTESVMGYIVGFNMRPVTSARKLAEVKGVDIKTYSIIYELIDDMKLALEGMLDPEKVEKYIGRAQVKDTFNVPKVGTIAGSSVIDGKIERGCNIRLLRSGKIVFDGKMSSLKRFKDDVKEVKNGFECGIGLDGYNDVKVDDIFEAYIMEEKKRKLVSSNVENY